MFFMLFSCLCVNVTGSDPVDVIHEHICYFCLCGILRSRTRPHPLVHRSWAVQSRPSTICYCRGWFLQLDGQLHSGNVLSVCCGKTPALWLLFNRLFNDASPFHNVLCVVILTSLSLSFTEPLWSICLYHFYYPVAVLLHFHVLQSPRDKRPDIWGDCCRFLPATCYSWGESVTWRAEQLGRWFWALSHSFFIPSPSLTQLLRERNMMEIKFLSLSLSAEYQTVWGRCSFIILLVHKWQEERMLFLKISNIVLYVHQKIFNFFFNLCICYRV